MSTRVERRHTPTKRHEAETRNGDKISFRAKPHLIETATDYARTEGYRGAGAVARKALIYYLLHEGYITPEEKKKRLV